MKRILTLSLVVLILIAITGFPVSAAQVSGDWEYTLSEGNAVISAYNGSDTSVIIPDTLDGLKVVGIGSKVFQNNYSLVSVVFPDSLESIGSYAFSGCTNLTSITLPAKLESVGSYAFADCKNVTKITVNSTKLSSFSSTYVFDNLGKDTTSGVSVVFGDGVTVIPDYMFRPNSTDTYARVKDVTISSSVVEIGEYAFRYCYDLVTVSIADNSLLETIGSYAFSDCIHLTSIVLPEKLESVGSYAFKNCKDMATITVHSKNLNDFSSTHVFDNLGKETSGGVSVVFSEGVTVIPAYMFYPNSTDTYARVKDVTISSSVTEIGDSAFRYCYDLETLSIPDNSLLEEIGSYAFNNCTSLTSLMLPVNLESVGSYAFENCELLSEITVYSKNLNDFGATRVFENLGKETANGVSVVFAEGVTLIPNYMFRPSSEDNYARIKDVTISSSVVEIGDYAFRYCADLISVSIPDNSQLEVIGDYAFSGCTNLPSIILPAKLETVDDYAFENCKRMSTITVNSKNLNDFSSYYVFDNLGKETANGVTVVFTEGVTVIPAYMFRPYSADTYARIKDVTVSSSVEEIGSYAFRYCYDLVSVSIPADSLLESIGSYAFGNCTSLPSITLPVKLTSVGSYAFAECRNMSSITVNSTNLSDFSSTYVFDNLGKDTNGVSVVFTEGVTVIPAYMFRPYSTDTYARVKNITISSSVEEIGDYAFRYCHDLVTVSIPDNSSLETIQSYAFSNCTALSSIKLPAKLEAIKSCAFEGCKNLTRLEIRSTTCSIYSNKNTLGEPETTVIYGHPGSTAQTYAERYGYQFVALTLLCDCDRISGSGRCETAIEVANRMKEILGIETFDTIIIANGDNFADALAGSYLATQNNAPILLYRANAVAMNLNYIQENLSEDGIVYLLGGTSAVPADVETGLREAGIIVKRLAGSNRFDTNLEILKEVGVAAGQEFLIATGHNFADSLSASATGLPILMVNNITGVLTDTQKAFLASLDGCTFTIVGGSSAVSGELENALSGYGNVRRLAGKTREETSVLVAETFFDSPDLVVLAYSRNFPDGLCGGPLAYLLDAPLLLTNAGQEAVAASYVSENGITRGLALGGADVLADQTVNAVFGVSN